MLVRIVVAPLVAGTIPAHCGITAERLSGAFGMAAERVAEGVRQGLAWALPNPAPGAM